jgi:uncharacterized protein (DUF488 family)
MKMVKLMFLISKERNLYDFVPYQYGPFSFQLYQDMRHLERAGFLNQMDDEVMFVEQPFPKPDFFLQDTINALIGKFGELSERDLVDFVYKKYPETTIFSNINRLKEYQRDETGIVTIGYEGRNIDAFLSLLIDNKIDKLIDVRRNPYSMKYGYSQKQIQSALEKLGISYLHIPELGIESAQRQNLTKKEFTELFSRYKLGLSEKEPFLEVIKSLAQREKVALMCFEAKAIDCHRGVIAGRFREEGINVVDL